MLFFQARSREKTHFTTDFLIAITDENTHEYSAWTVFCRKPLAETEYASHLLLLLQEYIACLLLQAFPLQPVLLQTALFRQG